MAHIVLEHVPSVSKKIVALGAMTKYYAHMTFAALSLRIDKVKFIGGVPHNVYTKFTIR